MDPIESSELFTEDPNLAITELDDGSAIVELPGEDTDISEDFYENLAETLDTFTVNKAASSLLDLIEKDQEARKKRDEQYELGLKRTGLGDDAPGGALFDGASRVVHPVLAEGCVDFAARAIKELFPVNGPVKMKVRGEATAQRLDLAKRKRDFLNWQLTNQVQEYRSEKEVLLTQLPLGGSQYEKYWFDPSLGRICMEFVPVDKVLLPFATTSFYTTPRLTHVQELTEDKFKSRIRSGFYLDIDTPTGTTPEETSSEKANDKIEGRESIADNPDGLRTVYEVSCTLDLEEEDVPKPYVIHIDESSGKIVAIYRNWMEDDPKALRLDWWVEDKFIPWRGAYGIGLPHLIGGLAASLTGALRALLDSAHINNSPGAVKLKGGRASGQNLQINQTEVKEIDAPAGVDDIRKVMMPLPFNPPSQVLFQLLDWLTAQAKGVVATAEEKIADVNQQMPVGTTLALIEQGSQVFSSIHSRLHDAQRRSLKIICRLNAQYPVEEMEKYGLTPEDFLDTDDIEPVSDPNIFSEAQRFAQLQEQMKVAAAYPQLNWNVKELARRALEMLRTDGIDSILPKDIEPITADPVSENAAAAKGTPLKASVEQDHQAHIQAHLTYILNPLWTALSTPMPQLAGVYNHVIEHLNLAYEQACMSALPTATAQLAAQDSPFNPDQVAAVASNIAAQQIGQIAQQLAPMLQQAGQVVAQKSPPPPVDPAVQKTFEASMAEIERKKQADAQNLQFEQQKFTQDTQAAQAAERAAMQMEQMKFRAEQMLEAQKEENRKQLAVISEMSKKEIEQLRAEVALAKNDQDNQMHQMTELMKNEQDGMVNVLIARMRQEGLVPSKTDESTNPVDGVAEQIRGIIASVENARSTDALTTMTQALKQLLESQSSHQSRTLELANKLLEG